MPYSVRDARVQYNNSYTRAVNKQLSGIRALELYKGGVSKQRGGRQLPWFFKKIKRPQRGGTRNQKGGFLNMFMPPIIPAAMKMIGLPQIGFGRKQRGGIRWVNEAHKRRHLQALKERFPERSQASLLNHMSRLRSGGARKFPTIPMTKDYKVHAGEVSDLMALVPGAGRQEVIRHLKKIKGGSQQTGGRRQTGGILPLAAAVPAMMAVGKALALGAASGLGGWGITKALQKGSGRRQVGGRPVRQKGGILPLAAAVPALIMAGKALALGGVSAGAGFGVKKLLDSF